MSCLACTFNRYGGVIVDANQLPQDEAGFLTQMTASLDLWRTAGHRTVWLSLPLARAALVPTAIAAGFVYHHAEPDYVMLTAQLVPDAFVPPHASHYIGAGAVVINESEELLVVIEKAHVQTNPGYYKLPGGHVHAGEHLVDAVIREVAEETGIETRFEAVVCLRHWHEYRYGKSDIYFICRLTPLSFEITLEEAEIAECRWLAVEDYLANPAVSVFNKRIVEAARYDSGLESTWFPGYDVDRQKREIFAVAPFARSRGE